MLLLCRSSYWDFPLRTTSQRNWHIRALRVPYRYHRMKLQSTDTRRIYDYNIPERALRRRWEQLYNINLERCYRYTPAGWEEHHPYELPMLYRLVEPWLQISTMVWYLVVSGLWTRPRKQRGVYRWSRYAPSDLIGMFHHEGGFTPSFADYLAVRVDLPRDFAYGLIVYQLDDRSVLTPAYSTVVWNLTDVPAARAIPTVYDAHRPNHAPSGTAAPPSSTPQHRRDA